MNEAPGPGAFLVAEDSEEDVLFLRRAIEQSGSELPFVVVRNGEEAIHYISGAGDYGDRSRHPAPSVMLLDLKMPKKSGLEVLQWMKENGLGLPRVIVLTSSDLTEDVRKAYELGAVAYIVKPASLGILKKIVKGLANYWKNPDLSAEGMLGWYIRPLA